MHHIWTDASVGPINAVIGFYFQSEEGLIHTKCDKCTLTKHSSSVEAELRAILYAVEFISKAVNKYPNIKSQFFTLYTDCRSSNDMIHRARFISNNHKPFLDQFKQLVKGLNISVQWVRRVNNKAHLIVYKESRKYYNQYMTSINVKGSNQPAYVLEDKSIERAWERFLCL